MTNVHPKARTHVALLCRCNGLKICEGQASAAVSMARVDSMIGEVMAACTPGSVVCLMVMRPAPTYDVDESYVKANDAIGVLMHVFRLALATASMRETRLRLQERAARRSS